jgi:hypothetical protein
MVLLLLVGNVHALQAKAALHGRTQRGLVIIDCGVALVLLAGSMPSRLRLHCMAGHTTELVIMIIMLLFLVGEVHALQAKTALHGRTQKSL